MSATINVNLNKYDKNHENLETESILNSKLKKNPVEHKLCINCLDHYRDMTCSLKLAKKYLQTI